MTARLPLSDIENKDLGVAADAAALAPSGLSPCGSQAKPPAANAWEPLSPACAACRWHKGTCFPGPCLLFRSRRFPELLEAARMALNYIENTEGEFGIALDSGDALRAAIAKALGHE